MLPARTPGAVVAMWVSDLGILRCSVFAARMAHRHLTPAVLTLCAGGCGGGHAPTHLLMLACHQTVQGRVRRRDVVPGMQEAGWRSCWTMLLMEPFHVSGISSWWHGAYFGQVKGAVGRPRACIVRQVHALM